MNNKKTGEYPITVSDWLIYLQGLSSLNTNLAIFFGSAIIIALIGIVGFGISYNSHPLLIILLVIIVYIVSLIVFKITGEFTKSCHDLSERIIKGELTEPSEILKEYNKIETKSKRKQML